MSHHTCSGMVPPHLTCGPPLRVRKSPWRLLFSQLQNPTSLSLFIGEVLQPYDHLHGPPLYLSQQLYVLHVLGELAPWVSKAVNCGWPTCSSPDCPNGFSKILLYVTTCSKPCYIQAVICIPGIVHVQSFYLCPMVTFLIIPVHLKFEGQDDNCLYPCEGQFPSDVCLLGIPVLCTCCKNPDLLLKTSPGPSNNDQEKVAL